MPLGPVVTREFLSVLRAMISDSQMDTRTCHIETC